MTGKRHGKGEYVYADGTKYIGSWDNDRIHGEGTSWYPNGNKYVFMNPQIQISYHFSLGTQVNGITAE